MLSSTLSSILPKQHLKRNFLPPHRSISSSYMFIEIENSLLNTRILATLCKMFNRSINTVWEKQQQQQQQHSSLNCYQNNTIALKNENSL